MDKCIGHTLLGDPCPYEATIGDYCILHAGGWDHFKANARMLWGVYGGVKTALGVLAVLRIVFGAGAVLEVVRDGETRRLDLDAMKDTAESLLKMLELFAELEDSRAELENIGPSVARLHEDVLLLVEHVANRATAQAGEGELA